MSMVGPMGVCLRPHQPPSLARDSMTWMDLSSVAWLKLQKPRIVHGSVFCNSKLRAVVKAHDLLDIRTRRVTPESNGIVERFNGTVRQDSDDYYGDNHLQAERVDCEALRRLQRRPAARGAGYLEPRELHFGNPEQRRQQRREKTRQSPAEQKNPKPQPNGWLTEPNHYNLGTRKSPS